MYGYGDAEERYMTHAMKVKHVERHAWESDPATTSLGDDRPLRSSAFVSWLGRLRHPRHPWPRLPRAESHG
jgi:hypothetical protein